MLWFYSVLFRGFLVIYEMIFCVLWNDFLVFCGMIFWCFLGGFLWPTFCFMITHPVCGVCFCVFFMVFFFLL